MPVVALVRTPQTHRVVRRLSDSSLLLSALATLAIGALSGQTVRGQVIDQMTSTPVGAGFVVLLDGEDREIERALTTPTGHFELRIPHDVMGPFRVRSERIGFSVAVTEPLTLTAAGANTLTIRVTALPTPSALSGERDGTDQQGLGGDGAGRCGPPRTRGGCRRVVAVDRSESRLQEPGG